MNHERTDIHRPSAIVPADYEFVANDYIGPSSDFMSHAVERRIYRAHRERTGGHTAEHHHGGTCQLCGASAFYVAYFYHAKTNTYLTVGHECAAKLELGEARIFKAFRKDIAERRRAGEARSQARAKLEAKGLLGAWDLYCAESREGFKYEENTITDIVGKLVRYGSISEAQERFLGNLLRQIPERAERAAKQAADAAAAKPIPAGLNGNRVHIAGEVLTVKSVDTAFGPTTKILVKHVDGWKLWGTKPAVRVERGEHIEFHARVEISKDDPKFGFFSRPTKASVTPVNPSLGV